MIKEIDLILEQFHSELEQQKTLAETANLKAKYLGKNGLLSALMKNLKELSDEEKKQLGQKSNSAKSVIEKALQQKMNQLEIDQMNQKLQAQAVDFSLRDSLFDRGLNRGGIHPVHSVQREVEDIFLSMGFEVLDGPYIEDSFHNFEALNIPADHPARDMQDTFWFADHQHLLRTHTSTIQVRGMQSRKPPFKFIGPGKVFRCERTDATHEMVFHQLEGMMVAEDLSVANLIYFMKTLLAEIFQKEMEVRLRPGYFPFVEPGFELDIRWKKPDPKKSEQRHSGWLELLPCGMVHPNVLQAGGIDPQKYKGFAFGLGLDRLVMVRHQIDDIRHTHSGDLRFNSQFSL